MNGMQPTFVELFAGVGGLSRGLETAGWQCKGHAEWDKHPRAVLRKQYSKLPLWGDVSKLSGHEIVREVGPFTMLTFGAPCQDFSIAGKRSGLTGERSILVMDALRIWEESNAPMALYENVVGMLSSNSGADFAGILSAFVGSDVAIPSRGWRGGGGVVRGRRGIAAWRVLDAQYFGVPQRRRRVFVLGARTPDIDPAQVLSLFEGVSGHSASRGKARQSSAADFRTGTNEAVVAVDVYNQTINTDGIAHTIRAHNAGEGIPHTISFDNRQHISTDGVTETLTTDGTRNPMSVVMRQREGKPGGGKGPLLSAERSLTLGTSNDQVVFPHAYRMVAFGEYSDDGTASAIKARDYKDATDLSIAGGIPRRLTPVECERLMGWPDHWTAEGIDESGKSYALSDSARYKACGNGVASPVAAWIGFRLKDAISTHLSRR